VHLSKDRKLCDVVLASSDPFIGVSLEPGTAGTANETLLAELLLIELIGSHR